MCCTEAVDGGVVVAPTVSFLGRPQHHMRYAVLPSSVRSKTSNDTIITFIGTEFDRTL
eukprot:JP442074.1.p2 GENE.JP442074.1~~JP442074.1.p2  ORF type:complete len:58 (+),score=0.19 JP442074.1:37-210(+)